MGKVIGVISLKGGVGKTTTVASLGAAISELGRKVLLVDGNFSSPTLGLHLNIIDPEKTIHHVLSRSSKVKEAVYGNGSFDVLPASMFENIKISPFNLKKSLSSMKRKYDVILIDSSPSLDEETLAVMMASDDLIVVTTPDRPTLGVTLKAIKLAKQRGTPIVGMIMNKVHDKNFEVSLPDIEETLGIPVLAVIPHDVNVLKALSNMEPYTSHKPRSQGSVEYKKLAAVLVGEKFKPKRIRDFFMKVTPNRQEINRTIFYKSVFDK